MRVLLPALKQPQTSTDLVGFNLHNPTNAIPAQYITFMQTFGSGAVQASDNLTANGLPAQMDVKTTHSDGSVRSALITFKHPMLPANSMTQFMLVKSASTPTRSPPSFAGLNLKVQIGTSTYIINDTFVAASSSFWQRGPLVAQARVNIPVSGSLRLTVDVTAYDDNTYAADVQFNNDAAMQASGGTQNYTATISWNGTTVLSQAVTHYQYQTWHKVLGGSPANVILDIAYLIRTGALPHLNLAAGADSGAIGTVTNAGPLQPGNVRQYMPDPGGRPDIGLMPGWNAVWLLTQDPKAKAYALAQADVAGSVPWHYFDPTKGTYLSLADYPTLWTDTRGTPTLKQAVKEPKWTPERAHMPDLCFVPYLLTGRRYYLDQINAQATFAEFGCWNDDTYGRKNGSGIMVGGFGEVRAAAWSMRMLNEAAWCNPTGSADQVYWQKLVDANWKFAVSKIPSWQGQQGEAYGRMAGEYGNDTAFAPWQQDYFSFVAVQAVLMGNADALTFLKWMSNWLVGRFLPKTGWNQRDGIAYNVSLGSTWAAMGSATVAAGQSNGTGWGASQGNYGEIALASLAGIIRVTGDVNAQKAYDWLKAQNPPLTTPYFDEVQFGVVPAATVAPPPPPPPPPPPRPAPATLSVAAASASAEGSSGTSPFTFTITRGGNTTISASADWAVTGTGSAPADAADFGGAFPTGTVSFAAGETSKQISIAVAGDSTVEPDENFTVTLSNPSANTTIATATAPGTIGNDDAAPPPPPPPTTHTAVITGDNTSVMVTGANLTISVDGTKIWT